MPYRSENAHWLNGPTVFMDEPQPAIAAGGRSLGTRIARGAAWMVVLRSADRILGFVSMLVLARLLVPEDFGLVALGMAVVGSLSAFSEFGFDLALIQNQSAERKHYDTAWTLGLLRGVLIAGILLLAAEPAASAMGDARLAELIRVLALMPLLESFANIGVVEFRKQLVFSKEFLYRFSSRLGGVITTLCLAFLWRDYWALVVGQLTTGALRLILSYILQPYRPRPSFAAWRDIFNFSKWLFLNGIAQFATKRASTFVVGAFLAPTSVGLMALSDEIMGLVSQALIAPIKRTFFPGFAKLSHDLPAMRTLLIKAYALTALFALPLSVGIGVTAELFVPLVLGANWLDTIPVIEILVYSALAKSLHGPGRPLLMALNRPEIVTVLSVVNASILIPFLIAGTWSAGLIGTAWALVGSSIIMVVVQLYVLWRFLKITAVQLLKGVWRSLASCGLMALVVWFIKDAVVPPQHASLPEQLLNLAIAVAAGALTYGLGLLVLWALSRCPADSAEGAVLILLKNRLLRSHQPSRAKATNKGETEA